MIKAIMAVDEKGGISKGQSMPWPKNSIDLKWFKENDIDYVSSIPSSDFDYDYDNIFEKKDSGTFFSRILNQ